MAAVLIQGLRQFFLPEQGIARPAPYAMVAGAAMALAISVSLTDPVQRLEWTVYDAFMRHTSGANAPAPGVVVVAIDELSFAEIGATWPWPRALHAQLIDAIAAQHPASIAFDVVFEGPGADPDGDVALADAIRRAGNVILGSDFAPIQDRNYSVTLWSTPLPQLAQAAAAVAAVSIPFDPDGALRRAVFSVDGRPSLAAAAVARDGAAPPASGDGSLIRFNGPPRLGIQTASYYQALDPKGSLPPGFFTGKHVFVGRSLRAPAADEADYFRTPVALQMAGVEVHATIADAMLRKRFIADPIDSVLALVLLCALVAGVVAAVAHGLPAGVASATAFGACVVVFAAGYGAFVADTWIPIVAPILTLASAYAAGAAYRFTLANRERRLIKRAFKNYLAPAIVEQMLADPSKLKLGGEEYEVSVLFSDLQGFTTLSERLTPQQLRLHLSGYFRDMLDRLLAERATLDKLIGDSIMVYFGCPIPDSAHPVQACRGALAMQRRMVELNAAWAASGLPQLRTRVGVNTGRAVAGNMGTDTIFNFTILGDCVNLASRLEGVNKEYGTTTMIGEDTYARVAGQFETRELDWIRVKGKLKPVAIYELVGEPGAIDRVRAGVFARYAEGLAAYRDQRWPEASAAFSAALALDPADGPSLTMSGRCQSYAVSGAGEAWDGVHVMHTK